MAGSGRGSEEEVLCRAGKDEEIEECPSKFDKEDIFCALVQPHLDYCCCLAGVLTRFETQT